jgi:hypothetical protein
MASDFLNALGGTLAGSVIGTAIGGQTGGGIGSAIGTALGSGQSFKSILNQAVQGDTVKDWDHANKTFVVDNYNLAPKNSFLYHVFFDINTPSNKLNGMSDNKQQTELGLMVKQISLPKFTIDTKTLNAYNRPNIVQTKIHYDPVSITFHDDSADIVRNFWFDYYSYYYRNSDYGGTQDLATYTSTHNELTSTRQNKDWGYTIRGTTDGTNIKEPYLTSIRIFSLHNKKFSEYVLVNPMIKSFQHGEHNSSASSETMQHSMNIEYESVLYAYGNITANTVTGFGELHYDKRPTPLSAAGGGTQSWLGPGGVLDSASEITQDLMSGNFGAALFKGARVSNGLKGANLGTMAVAEALSLGRGILSSGSTGNNPFGGVAIPSISGLMTNIGGGAAALIGKLKGPSNVTTTSQVSAESTPQVTYDSDTGGKTTYMGTSSMPQDLLPSTVTVGGGTRTFNVMPNATITDPGLNSSLQNFITQGVA